MPIFCIGGLCTSGYSCSPFLQDIPTHRSVCSQDMLPSPQLSCTISLPYACCSMGGGDPLAKGFSTPAKGASSLSQMGLPPCPGNITILATLSDLAWNFSCFYPALFWELHREKTLLLCLWYSSGGLQKQMEALVLCSHLGQTECNRSLLNKQT